MFFDVQDDEMEGEQEFFMRLDKYTEKFGAPSRDKIVSWYEFIISIYI